MNIHKNARLTRYGRERIVRQVESGQTPQAVAEAAGVCPRTVRKWVDRYHREGLSGLEDRSSRPHRLRRPTPEAIVGTIERLRRQRWTGKQIAAEVGVSPATVSRVLRRLGPNKLSALDPEPVRRYEREHPANSFISTSRSLAVLARWDTASLGRQTGVVNRHLGIGWEFVHVCIDDASRVAFVQVMSDERKESAVAFLEAAVAYYARRTLLETRARRHAAAKRDGEMSEITADAGLVDVSAVRSPLRIGVLIVEGYMVVHEVTNRLNSAPSGRRRSELGPSKITETIGLAITAAEQKHQRVVRQIIDTMLNGIFGDIIGLTVVVDLEVGRYRAQAGGSHDPGACVAEAVGVVPCFNRTIEGQDLIGQEIDAARRMNAEDEQHRGWLGAFVAQCETGTDFHRSPLTQGSLPIWQKLGMNADRLGRFRWHAGPLIENLIGAVRRHVYLHGHSRIIRRNAGVASR